MTPDERAKRISQRYPLTGSLTPAHLEYEIWNAIESAVSDERKACAQIADSICYDWGPRTAKEIAKAIRARSESHNAPSGNILESSK